MAGRETAPIYLNSIIVLFIGGFMIALAMEKWNLHRRIALQTPSSNEPPGTRRASTSAADPTNTPARIVLGFMVAAAFLFLSMWISQQQHGNGRDDGADRTGDRRADGRTRRQMEERARPFSTGLMLGVAYGCSTGGMTTLVGTPPNLSFTRIFQIMFPDAPEIAFGQWMIVAFPVGVLMLLITWLLITQVLYRAPADIAADRTLIDRERERLGPMSFEERAVLTVFISTALLWVFRADLNLGAVTLPGWSRLLPWPKLIDDGTVAITMASLMFFIPARDAEGRATRLLDAQVIPRLPWSVVLLIGGGFALATGFQQTGLAELVGGQFGAAGELPTFLLILVVCLSITFLTELTSNTATTEMILPILAAVAVVSGTHPLVLMIPATMSASCAFMMPVATPPNAIVFGSNRISIAQMARAGIFLNLIGALVITSVVYTLGLVVFDIDPGALPDWASSIASE